jgi:hypothetical protein
LLRDCEHGVSLQGAVKSLIHREQNLLFGSGGILIFRLGREAGAGGQVRGASEVGDQLTHGNPGSRALIDDGIVESTSGDAAVIERIHAGEVSRGSWPQTGTHFPRNLFGRQRRKSSHGYLRIVLQRQGLGLLQ